MAARVRVTLYAQIGSGELVPLGFRMIEDSSETKRQIAAMMRSGADLIEPQAEVDLTASEILKREFPDGKV